VRRARISERIKKLQGLLPKSDKFIPKVEILRGMYRDIGCIQRYANPLHCILMTIKHKIGANNVYLMDCCWLLTCLFHC
ncbi:hypothetical protein HN873_009871, partial [Arachis hypogaea]